MMKNMMMVVFLFLMVLCGISGTQAEESGNGKVNVNVMGYQVTQLNQVAYGFEGSLSLLGYHSPSSFPFHFYPFPLSNSFLVMHLEIMKVTI